jgi:2-polyprenyl-3-methyl-5-hydroxy-6-metoxy-1,4-benzoquinol methylase
MAEGRRGEQGPVMNLADKTKVSGLFSDKKPVITLNPLQLAEREKYLSRLLTGQYVETPVDRCPLCAVCEGWLVAAKDRYGLPVKTAVCKNCGLVFTANPLDQSSMARFYAEQYRRLYEGKDMSGSEWAERSSSWFDERLDFPDTPALKMAEQAGDDLSNFVVAELGCGGGWNLYGFHKRGARVIGFDYDEILIEEGRKLGMRMHAGSVGEAIALGIKADLVILSHVMEHVASPVEFLSKIRQILKLRGTVFITQPGLKSFQFGGWGGGLGHQLQNAHNFIFEVATLKLLADITGYSVPFCNEGLNAILCQSDVVAHPNKSPARGDKVLRYLSRLKFIEHFWNCLARFKGGDQSRPYRLANRISTGCARRLGYPI